MVEKGAPKGAPFLFIFAIHPEPSQKRGPTAPSREEFLLTRPQTAVSILPTALGGRGFHYDGPQAQRKVCTSSFLAPFVRALGTITHALFAISFTLGAAQL
jgi:hypothetical protein